MSSWRRCAARWWPVPKIVEVQAGRIDARHHVGPSATACGEQRKEVSYNDGLHSYGGVRRCQRLDRAEVDEGEEAPDCQEDDPPRLREASVLGRSGHVAGL